MSDQIQSTFELLEGRLPHVAPEPPRGPARYRPRPGAVRDLQALEAIGRAPRNAMRLARISSRLLGRCARVSRLRLAHPRGFTQEVMGEAGYRRNPERIVRPKAEHPVRRERIAVLARETEKKSDPNAVCVQIGRRNAGYLPRNLAPTNPEQLSDPDRFLPAAEVRAKVVGGCKGTDNEGHSGIRLNLKWPLQIAMKS